MCSRQKSNRSGKSNGRSDRFAEVLARRTVRNNSRKENNVAPAGEDPCELGCPVRGRAELGLTCKGQGKLKRRAGTQAVSGSTSGTRVGLRPNAGLQRYCVVHYKCSSSNIEVLAECLLSAS